MPDLRWRAERGELGQPAAVALEPPGRWFALGVVRAFEQVLGGSLRIWESRVGLTNYLWAY